MHVEGRSRIWIRTVKSPNFGTLLGQNNFFLQKSLGDLIFSFFERLSKFGAQMIVKASLPQLSSWPPKKFVCVRDEITTPSANFVTNLAFKRKTGIKVPFC
jgi:hypothetical protein